MHLVGQAQLLLHTRCEQASQLPCFVAPGAQAPSPVQLPQLQLELQVLVPQLPQACVAPGVQVPWPEHVPKLGQVQVDGQVRL